MATGAQKKLTLREILTNASQDLYRLALEDCAAEARALNAANALEHGSDRWFVEGRVRPIFFTGDPAAVTAGEYFIVVSMNPKFEPDPDGSRDARLFWTQVPQLNASAVQHYDECASHFAPNRTPHSFFGTLRPTAEAFAAARGLRVSARDRNALLRHTVLALEAIPFFSKASGRLENIPPGRIVELNRRVRVDLLRHHPPAAIYGHGTGGRELLESFASAGTLSEWRDGAFEHRKTRRKGERAGTTFACRYQFATLTMGGARTVKVVWTPFVRSVYGPGTREQRAELGALLAATALPTPAT